MKPKRIQRKRTSGWKMPENTIYVGRPTEFGNPFKVGDYVKIGNGGNGLKLMRALNAQYANSTYTHIETIKQCVELYRKYITNYPPKNLHELQGKNLACWCKEGEPCHADVLLEIANQITIK